MLKLKFLAALLVAAMMLTFAACGTDSTDKPSTNGSDPIQDSSAATVSQTPDVEEETQASSESKNNSDTVYSVGTDMPAGSYLIHCTETGSQLEIIVFAGQENYDEFQQTEQSTIGEHKSAVEQHAWANFYLNQSDSAYIGLREGSIIVLRTGEFEFTEYDPAASLTLYPGIYVIGEDFIPGKVQIKCSSDYMQVTLFENKGQYLAYHQASRFTLGEESDAIETYAKSTAFIYSDDSTDAVLQEGMVLMIADGVGNYTVDDSGEAAPSEGLVDGMRPEFKAAMDSYEAFYDEYCDYMKRYKENPTDLALLTQYGEMLSRAAEMSEKFEAWDENEMNAAELAYYIEVNGRVTQKLLEVSQ